MWKVYDELQFWTKGKIPTLWHNTLIRVTRYLMYRHDIIHRYDFRMKSWCYKLYRLLNPIQMLSLWIHSFLKSCTNEISDKVVRFYRFVRKIIISKAQQVKHTFYNEPLATWFDCPQPVILSVKDLSCFSRHIPPVRS